MYAGGYPQAASMSKWVHEIVDPARAPARGEHPESTEREIEAPPPRAYIYLEGIYIYIMYAPPHVREHII